MSGKDVKGICMNNEIEMKDTLVNCLINLAQNTEQDDGENTKLLLKGLAMSITNQKADPVEMEEAIEKITALVGQNNFDINQVQEEDEDMKLLKLMILLNLKNIGAYAYNGMFLGCCDDKINKFVYEALRNLNNQATKEELLATLIKARELTYMCKQMKHIADMGYVEQKTDFMIRAMQK